MGKSRSRRRKPARPLPPVPKYIRAPVTGGPRWTWRLGGPMTRAHEAEARAAEQSRPPSRLGMAVLRLLGYRPRRGDD